MVVVVLLLLLLLVLLESGGDGVDRNTDDLHTKVVVDVDSSLTEKKQQVKQKMDVMEDET